MAMLYAALLGVQAAVLAAAVVLRQTVGVTARQFSEVAHGQR